ncbi:MAG: hypothetical protein ACLP1X_30030 [Polyangiaceae bacterium]
MRYLGRAATVVALLELAPAVAVAQTPTATATDVAPTPAAAPAEAATTASTETPPHVVVPATGYGWSDPKKKGGHAPSVTRVSHRAKSDAPDATMPGFETLADGSSRLFVELSKPVKYETKSGIGTITYVLKGAHVSLRNNYNPLVTVHFNTPVASARLVPHGSDLWFVVSLRGKTQPTVTLDGTKDGGSMLRVEFPKGDYLPATRAADATPADTNGH